MNSQVMVLLNEQDLLPKEKLTNRLRLARAAKNLTFAQIGDRLAVSETTAHRWESQGSIPSTMLSRWAEVTEQPMELFRV